MRIAELCPDQGWFTRRVINAIHAEDERWWAPEDIPAPPTTELVTSGSVEFTRQDVARVLSDL
ncbi:MAG TPA: hypothetical protein VIX82_15890 [Solirubrobacteraceae bacterium]